MGHARIVSVNISSNKGVRKTPIPFGELVPEVGLLGDAHSCTGDRQLSLLALESIKTMQDKGLEVKPGDFAENITTEGLVLHTLPKGTRLRLGGVEAVLTQIGKTCHAGCIIRELTGDCVMPREGVFVRVLSGGQVRPGDEVQVLPGPGKGPREPE